MKSKKIGLSAGPLKVAEEVVHVESDGSAGTVDCESPLFRLFVARVGQADLIHTVRRDVRAIFRESLIEAKAALDVFENYKEDNSHE